MKTHFGHSLTNHPILAVFYSSDQSFQTNSECEIIFQVIIRKTEVIFVVVPQKFTSLTSHKIT